MRNLGLVLAVGVFGCANTVPQDRSTGPDGKQKGALPVALENGEGRVKGIVTYPGGDRIDWKVIELPEKAHGKLDLSLTWHTPRPGLQVAFDVFDAWNHPIVATKAASKKGGRARSATINDAVGKYFVRIYAPKRGDAGAYTLTANFTAEDDHGPIDPKSIPIPDPPKLAAVPDPPLTCPTFDANNEGCKNACPDDAPEGWKGCKKRDDDAKHKADVEAQRAAHDECMKNQPTAFEGRIIHVEVSGDGVTIKLDKGTDSKPLLTTGWTAKVLIDGTDSPIANGSVKLLSVGRTQTKGVSGLTVDQLNSNSRVRFSPPAPNCP